MQNSALKRELDSWLGTPWAHLASEAGYQRPIKRVGGDCKTIVAQAFTDAGLIEPLKFPAHGVRAGLAAEHQVEDSVSRYLGRFVEQGRMTRHDPRLEPIEFGDVLTFRFGAREHHIGVATGHRGFYHCPGAGHSFCISDLGEARFHGALRWAYRLEARDQRSEARDQTLTSEALTSDLSHPRRAS